MLLTGKMDYANLHMRKGNERYVKNRRTVSILSCSNLYVNYEMDKNDSNLCL